MPLRERLIRFLNWWNGWRLDLDDWWVRARRESDPSNLPSSIGFLEEACIVVRTPEQAREVDTGAIAEREEVYYEPREL
ncbi:hypothetical protein [Ancylobacter rudongensis]|uniref:Uncharacterized protein n=1 Tax=Ancylobacter rudongensis TaxID=177413 RepID=A0A1G4UNV6_9HYPH|nr:hypothetical protein [Ancylobacter rudongensis]SCW95351.1 hypothetical protein SAMN05660859_0004 [Ancylobacter rudongensis]